jgi:hypothetical protein
MSSDEHGHMPNLSRTRKGVLRVTRSMKLLLAVAGCSALLVSLGLALTSGRLRVFSASASEANGALAALPTPTRGEGTNHPPKIAPTGARPYLSPLAFDGSALVHGVSTTYDWATGVPDESNGKTVFAEFWIHLAQDGAPDGFVGSYSVEGEVVQTIVQDSRSMTVRFDYSLPGPAPTCRADSVSSQAALAATFPQTVTAGTLSANGFVQQGSTQPPSIVLPNTAPGSRVFEATSAEAWRSTGTQPASRVLSFDSSTGRLLTWTSTRHNEAGVLVGEHDESYGQLELIAGASLAPIAERIVAEGPCHE